MPALATTASFVVGPLRSLEAIFRPETSEVSKAPGEAAAAAKPRRWRGWTLQGRQMTCRAFLVRDDLGIIVGDDGAGGFSRRREAIDLSYFKEVSRRTGSV